ncbi:hypothetical protein B0J12DRAFT_387820 [Macrophomina phaseolina]|uniref:Uncharacterized protein n=1 Tax=Macrophomina phaseolina TaxID=35725 RepID=A0ABQ8FSY8_9PEZI|nr:hypothetical protein B0J12DRAFT_387820 [Macrophomina phaseolina]
MPVRARDGRANTCLVHNVTAFQKGVQVHERHAFCIRQVAHAPAHDHRCHCRRAHGRSTSGALQIPPRLLPDMRKGWPGTACLSGWPFARVARVLTARDKLCDCMSYKRPQEPPPLSGRPFCARPPTQGAEGAGGGSRGIRVLLRPLNALKDCVYSCDTSTCSSSHPHNCRHPERYRARRSSQPSAVALPLVAALPKSFRLAQFSTSPSRVSSPLSLNTKHIYYRQPQPSRRDSSILWLCECHLYHPAILGRFLALQPLHQLRAAAFLTPNCWPVEPRWSRPALQKDCPSETPP